jgi:hypothetical protein
MKARRPMQGERGGKSAISASHLTTGSRGGRLFNRRVIVGDCAFVIPLSGVRTATLREDIHDLEIAQIEPDRLVEVGDGGLPR